MMAHRFQLMFKIGFSILFLRLNLWVKALDLGLLLVTESFLNNMVARSKSVQNRAVELNFVCVYLSGKRGFSKESDSQGAKY